MQLQSIVEPPYNMIGWVYTDLPYGPKMTTQSVDRDLDSHKAPYNSSSGTTVRLAHGKPVLCGWARLVVPVGFGCPGGLPGVLRLHVSRVRVVREHAHWSLAMQSRSIGMCRRGCPDPDRMMDRAQPVYPVCVCICTVYICTHSRILALLANVHCLSYDFK